MSDPLTAITNSLEKAASSVANYVTGGNVQVYVKTNLGPATRVYNGTTPDSGKPSLAQRLGLKAQVIVEDAKGQQIATYGDPAPTDKMRQAIAAGIVLLFFVIVLWILWRAFIR